MNDLERRQAWLAFASAALSGLGAKPRTNLDKLVVDASNIADEMLDEYLDLFDPEHDAGGQGSDTDEDEVEERRRRKR